MADDAQSTTISPADELKKEAEARKAAAEADKAEVEAQQAKLKAQFPSGEAKPAEGKITADDKAGYIATFAAYDALKRKADEIAGKINGPSLDKAHILIVDSIDFASSDTQLIQVLNQITFCASEIGAYLDKIKEFAVAIDKISKLARQPKPSPAAKKTVSALAPIAVSEGLQMVKGFVSTLADIVGYFKVDWEIKGQEIKLSNTALHSLVAGRLAAKGHSVFLPGFFRIPPTASIDVLEKFNQCITKKGELKDAITELKKSLNHPVIVSKKTDGTSDEKKLISNAEKACEDTEAFIREFAEFNKALVTAPQGGGYSPLAAAALRQYLDTMGITHLLYLAVTSSGGEMVIGKGLFYFASPGFLGGCVVSYVLAKCSGEIVAADTVFGYSNVKYHLYRNILSPFKHREIEKQNP
jgi:hypothetical protein